MDLWSYPLILESTDIQQAAELNSTMNVSELAKIVGPDRQNNGGSD
jgi:hypothetical protein